MGGWRPRDLKDYVAARTVDGGIWELSGELIAMGTGRVLAKVRGVEEVVCASNVRRVAGVNDQNSSFNLPGSPSAPAAPRLTHSAQIVSRKTLFYVDPSSGERMTVFRYRPTAPPRPVFPILSPPARIDVAIDVDSRLVISRPVPSADKQKHSPPLRASLRSVIGEPPLRPFRGMLSMCWTFIGRGAAHATSAKTPNKPGVIEEYHYMLGQHGGVGSWVRLGRCPSWYSGGQCMMKLRSVRIKGGAKGLNENLQSWLAKFDRSKALRADDADLHVPQHNSAVTRPPKRFKIF